MLLECETAAIPCVYTVLYGARYPFSTLQVMVQYTRYLEIWVRMANLAACTIRSYRIQSFDIMKQILIVSLAQ